MSWLHHWFIPHESNNQRAKLLHPSALVVIITVLTVFQLLLGNVSHRYPQILGYAAQISATDIVRLTNEQRQANGRGVLNLDEQLSAAAAKKAADMVAKDYWAHVSPDGTQPWSFITDSGYQYRYAGENLARDFSEASAIVKAWMDSPTHRDNLLNSRYQDIGIAVVDGTLGDRETTLVVQLFGTRLAAAPSAPTAGQTALAPAVKAAAPTLAAASPTLVASTSPFDVTKSVSIALLAVFVVVLVVDVMAMRQRKIVRWTSKSWAHLALMLFLLLTVILINRGVIL